MRPLVLAACLLGAASSGLAQQQADTRVARPGGDLPGDVAVQLVKVADGLVDPVSVASPPIAIPSASKLVE